MTQAAHRPGWPGRLALRAAASLALGYVLLPLVLISGGPRFQRMGPVVYGQFAGLRNWPFGAASPSSSS